MKLILAWRNVIVLKLSYYLHASQLRTISSSEWVRLYDACSPRLSLSVSLTACLTVSSCLVLLLSSATSFSLVLASLSPAYISCVVSTDRGHLKTHHCTLSARNSLLSAFLFHRGAKTAWPQAKVDNKWDQRRVKVTQTRARPLLYFLLHFSHKLYLFLVLSSHLLYEVHRFQGEIKGSKQ